MKKSYLDSLRGLAALIVVFAHFAGAFYPFSLFGTTYKRISASESILNQSPVGLLIAGHFAVCLFFVLSGYVLSYRFIAKKRTKICIVAATVKRPFRLGGMVVFTMALSYLLMCCGFYLNSEVALLTNSIPWFESYWETTPSLTVFLVDLIIRPFSQGSVYNPPLWTISTELYGSYFVFAYLFFVGNMRYRLVPLILLMYIFRNSLYLCFLLGIFCAELERIIILKKFKFPNYFLLGMLPVGLFFGSYPHYADNITIDSSIYGWLPSRLDKLGQGGYALSGALIVFCCVLCCHPLQTLLDKKILRYFGRISYALYALHFILLGSLSSFIYLILISNLGHNLAFFCALMLSLFLLIPCADVTNRWVDTYSIRVSHWLGKSCESYLNAAVHGNRKGSKKKNK